MCKYDIAAYYKVTYDIMITLYCYYYLSMQFVMLCKCVFSRKKLSDYKCLFKLFNLLLNKYSEISLPTNKSSPELVAEFSTYFTKKITSIRTKLISDEGAQINPIVDYSPCSVPSPNQFLPVTSDELKIIVNRSPPTNCDLDLVPTKLLKEQLDCIIPLMVDIVNKSLCSGVFPDCLKQAIVVPLLKKKSLQL